MRFVFDTNVLVSALLLEHSVSRRAFDRALDHGKLVLSFAALRELNEVLSRRQFRKYVDEDDIHRFLASLVRQAMWVEVSAKITACRDPNDDKFLELAVSGLATHIVTGDQDLLVLDPFQGISILTPHAFLDLLLPPPQKF
ncbi:MAG: putative toxin-antitoxin system toxin component, PIN family [Acidobacteria bacterium]|nr:MAG: putative toxin-antitoxin system toxin component, PIN family [Acidobacteriota bacterium]